MATPKDWIGSPAEWGQWGQRATAWFNELRDYAKLNRDDLDGHISDFNDHLNDAGWTDPVTGTTFNRADSTTVSGRIADNYSTTREKFMAGVRQTFESGSTKLQYDSTGGNEIYRLDRTNRRMEHHTGAMLQGNANYYTNWQDYGGSYAPVKWYRHPSGLVVWEGLVRRVGSASGAPNAILLTDGNARATRTQQMWVCMSNVGAIRVDHFANGQIVTQTSIGINGWISFGNIRYMDDWR